MLREAELFVMAQDVLVEVVGRIRPEHRHLVIPPQFDRPGSDAATPLPRLVEQLAHDDAWVPAMLAGKTMDEIGRDRFDGDLLGDDRHASYTRIAEAASAAARDADDPGAVVHCSYGDVGVQYYLWQITIWRAFSAHDIAMHLGSRACPLTEDLARGLWEGTFPDVELWRERGVFRAQFEPMPADVSWRDRFLIDAGRDPHAL